MGINPVHNFGARSPSFLSSDSINHVEAVQFSSGTGTDERALILQSDNHLLENNMEDRSTIRITALLLGGVFLTCFTLAAISMP